MKLWMLSQNENSGYDTYDGAVVAAGTAEAARRIHPCGYKQWDEEQSGWRFTGRGSEQPACHDYSWANDLTRIKVTLIGKATRDMEAGLILGSFNAG